MRAATAFWAASAWSSRQKKRSTRTSARRSRLCGSGRQHARSPGARHAPGGRGIPPRERLKCRLRRSREARPWAAWVAVSPVPRRERRRRSRRRDGTRLTGRGGHRSRNGRRHTSWDGGCWAAGPWPGRWWPAPPRSRRSGVAATGVVIARDQRRRRAYTPQEIRERLHARLTQAPPARPPR